MTRRLTLMNEVLPTPSTNPNGSVRARTLARLKVLAALGAAAVLAGCGKVVDDENGGDGGGKGITNGGNDGGPDAYGVVDPLPAPACFEYQQINATGTYLDADGGALDGGTDGGAGRQVEVDIEYAQTGVVLSNVAGTKNAEFVTSASTTSTAKLIFSIEDGATEATATAKVSCMEGMTTLTIDLVLGPDAVEVTVTERGY